MSKVSSPLQVRLGLVGLGAMGRHHARSVFNGEIPGCVLAAVCDVNRERGAEFPGLPFFPDHKQLLRSGLIDAVLIATPHYSHTAIGVEALDAGLHVLVEKPISVHKADAEKLLSAHRNRKQVFAAMFNQRTDPCYQKIRAMVRGGELGQIRRIQWTVTDWFRSQAYYDSGSWRATWAGEGGGVLLNQCVHNIDLFQWIFGMPKKVRALCQMGRHHDIEVEDDVTAIFEYEDGTTAVLVTSTGEAPGVNRLEISGERGRLTLENGQLVFLRNEVETSAYSKSTREGYLPPPSWRAEISLPSRGEQHAGILKNFTRAILQGEEPIAPAADGIHSVELINAVLLASLRDKTVELPLSSSEYARLLRELVRKSKTKKRVVSYQGSAANYLDKK